MKLSVVLWLKPVGRISASRAVVCFRSNSANFSTQEPWASSCRLHCRRTEIQSSNKATTCKPPLIPHQPLSAVMQRLKHGCERGSSGGGHSVGSGYSGISKLALDPLGTVLPAFQLNTFTDCTFGRIMGALHVDRMLSPFPEGVCCNAFGIVRVLPQQNRPP